jgi:hypothetical protein
MHPEHGTFTCVLQTDCRQHAQCSCGCGPKQRPMKTKARKCSHGQATQRLQWMHQEGLYLLQNLCTRRAAIADTAIRVIAATHTYAMQQQVHHIAAPGVQPRSNAALLHQGPQHTGLHCQCFARTRPKDTRLTDIQTPNIKHLACLLSHSLEQHRLQSQQRSC